MISRSEWKKIVLYFLVIIAMFGTVTALWENPIFIRKIEVKPLDYIVFTIFSILGAFHMGIENKVCQKSSTFGGILGFLGFACPTCNMILVYIVGNSFLMTYFEPIRHIIGFVGIVILAQTLYKKLVLNSNVM